MNTAALTAEHLQRLRAIVEAGTPLARNTVLQLIENAAADPAAPEICTLEQLTELPIGTVIYAASNIGPAERFKEGWFGCGTATAWSSQTLARDGLPAVVIYRRNR